MDIEDLPKLIDRLRNCAEQWADASDKASLARLGRLVVNDNGFFSRLESPGATTTVATVEKFAAFLVDAGNWPEGVVPNEARGFAHVVGISAPLTAPSAGKGDEVSPAEKAA